MENSTDTNERKMEMKSIEETGYAGLESIDTQETKKCNNIYCGTNGASCDHKRESSTQETTTDTMEERMDNKLRCLLTDENGQIDWDLLCCVKKHIRNEISLALQKREEELREKIEELRIRFKCAKCDGAKTLEHTQCCQALNIIQQP